MSGLDKIVALSAEPNIEVKLARLGGLLRGGWKWSERDKKPALRGLLSGWRFTARDVKDEETANKALAYLASDEAKDMPEDEKEKLRRACMRYKK